MSKEMNSEELCNHTGNAINELSGTLKDFRESKIAKFRKRAMLLGYWIKTYVRYLKHEDEFSSQSVFRLKRGSVISVEFGYRVGRELGGRHYAVVLDIKNDLNSNVVTVVPLGSVKQKTETNKHCVVLTNGIFKAMKNKLDALVEDARASITEIEETDKKMLGTSEEELAKWKIIRLSKMKYAKEIIDSCFRHFQEIDHMKAGSIAHISQITTISKMRIVNPLQKTHPLYGLRLSTDDMDLIDIALKLKYFPSKKIAANDKTEND